MSHWAEVDESNIVIRVTTGNNEDPDEGYQWLIDNLGGTWIKTSYNAASNGFRNKYAGTGDTWHPELDAFVSPQIYPSWSLDLTGNWIPPIPKPESLNNEFYVWDEESLTWVIYVITN